MFWATSIALFSAVCSAILWLTWREIRQFRRYQRELNDIYPYSRRRLWIRSTVSACLAAEAFLLLIFRHLLSVQRPLVFFLYVIAVGAIAVGMAVLALLDLKESRRLQNLSEKRLLKEFLSEVGRRERGEPH